MSTAVVLPDVEQLVCDRLRDQVPGTAVGTTLVDWADGTRHLLVRRTGGRVRYRWLDEAEIAVEARAESREAARLLAAQARSALASIADWAPPSAVVSSAAELRGPGWRPDPDGKGRYEQAWQIKTHPLPAGG